MGFPLSLFVSILFHYLSALCLADSTDSVAEVVWRECDLAWKTLWCSALRCSSGLRAEISLVVPLTTRDSTIGIALPFLTEQHIGTSSISRQSSVIQAPEIPAAGEQQGDCFFDLSLVPYLLGICLCFLFSLVTNFSRVWASFVSPSCCLKYPESSPDGDNDREEERR